MDGTLITVAVITAVPSTLAVLVGWRNGRKIAEVKQEVVTGNGKTLGALATAVETRRIDEIAPQDRTLGELAHQATVAKSQEDL